MSEDRLRQRYRRLLQEADIDLRASRTRMGQFRAMDDRLDDMRPGDQINLLKVVQRDTLPGVQSARLFRAQTGFIVSINAGKDIYERHHQGKMSKDDLEEYLTQIIEEMVRVKEARTRGDRVDPIRHVRVKKAAEEGKVPVERK